MLVQYLQHCTNKANYIVYISVHEGVKVTHSLCMQTTFEYMLLSSMHVYSRYSVAACLDFGMGELHTIMSSTRLVIATLYYSTDMHVSSLFTNCIYSINTILYQNHN